jgi:hypothetical protein
MKQEILQKLLSKIIYSSSSHFLVELIVPGIVYLKNEQYGSSKSEYQYLYRHRLTPPCHEHAPEPVASENVSSQHSAPIRFAVEQETTLPIKM